MQCLVDSKIDSSWCCQRFGFALFSQAQDHGGEGYWAWWNRVYRQGMLLLVTCILLLIVLTSCSLLDASLLPTWNHLQMTSLVMLTWLKKLNLLDPRLSRSQAWRMLAKLYPSCVVVPIHLFLKNHIVHFMMPCVLFVAWSRKSKYKEKLHVAQMIEWSFC